MPRRAALVHVATRCPLTAASSGLRRAGNSRSRPANACTTALSSMRSPPCTGSMEPGQRSPAGSHQAACAYRFGTDCFVQCVQTVHAQGLWGGKGRSGTHLHRLLAGWGPDGLWFESIRPIRESPVREAGFRDLGVDANGPQRAYSEDPSAGSSVGPCCGKVAAVSSPMRLGRARLCRPGGGHPRRSRGRQGPRPTQARQARRQRGRVRGGRDRAHDPAARRDLGELHPAARRLGYLPDQPGAVARGAVPARAPPDLHRCGRRGVHTRGQLAGGAVPRRLRPGRRAAARPGFAATPDTGTWPRCWPRADTRSSHRAPT